VAGQDGNLGWDIPSSRLLVLDETQLGLTLGYEPKNIFNPEHIIYSTNSMANGLNAPIQKHVGTYYFGQILLVLIIYVIVILITLSTTQPIHHSPSVVRYCTVNNFCLYDWGPCLVNYQDFFLKKS
jgi:hypothetical protein